MSLSVIFILWLLAILCLAPWAERRWGDWLMTFRQRLVTLLESFHLFLNPKAVQSGLLLGFFVVAVLTFLLVGSIWALPLLIAVVAIGFMAAVRFQLARRFYLVRQQLPGVLELLATSLRAGLSIRAAFVEVARQAPAPVSKELAVLERMQRVGIDLQQALSDWATRVPLEEVSLIKFAISVSHASGGNLADALDRLAATFRQRLLLEEKLDALTAQGRLQAWIMVSLPIVLALVLTAIDPDSMRLLWFSSAGHLVLAGVVLLEITGLLWIRKLIRIDF